MDLNAPLGMMPPPRRKRRVGLVIGIVAIVSVIGASIVVSAVSDPRNSEPSAIAAIPPALPTAVVRSDGAQTAMQQSIGTGPVDRTPTASIAQNGTDGLASRNADEATMENGVKVFRASPPGISTSVAADARGPLIIDVSRALDDPHRSSKIASAAPDDTVKAPTTHPDRPRIAIFVSGMGLNESVTRTAIEIMPSAVTLAFLPMGAGITSSVAAAKARSHEVLLQLPMRNNASDRMPHMIEPSEPAAALSEDLTWLMGRFEGYDGVANLLGAPVSADQTVMSTIMKAVRDRHLFYLDDGTSRQSVATTVASSVGASALKSDVVLDATADATVVKTNLEALAAIARRKGSAIGMASGQPDHMAAIAAFAAGLQAQGIELVPVSALADAATSAASAR